jgi:hypothetical protein
MAEDHAGDPAQAFEDLRAEVSVLRRAIEALPAAIRENRPADYSADLGVLGKGLDEIGEQLETITKSPALMMTPAQQGESIAKAGNNLIREAAGKLNDAARTIEGERLQLSQIVGHAWKQDRQFKLMCWTGGAALAIGLILSPLVATILPFGLNTRVAALIMREDRWAAGADLMKAGNPARWARLSADAQLVSDNREVLDACRAAAARTGKAQRCTMPVSAPNGAAAESVKAP